MNEPNEEDSNFLFMEQSVNKWATVANFDFKLCILNSWKAFHWGIIVRIHLVIVTNQRLLQQRFIGNVNTNSTTGRSATVVKD